MSPDPIDEAEFQKQRQADHDAIQAGLRDLEAGRVISLAELQIRLERKLGISVKDNRRDSEKA